MRITILSVFACALLLGGVASAEDLIVDGGSVTLAGIRRYDHVCVINGGTVHVAPYDRTTGMGGNLELVASSVFIDDSSLIDARGTGYAARLCYHGDGPTQDAGGRGGCAVMDSGGGGAHFGRGGRGTVDDPTTFDTHFEDNCDDCSSGSCTHVWTGSTCSSFAGCGVDYLPPGAIDVEPPPDGNGCPDKPNADDGRFCKLGPSVAGAAFWHNIYEPQFGAAGGDKGCRDGDGAGLATAGNGGGRVVLVGLADRLSTGGSARAPAACGVQLDAGQVRIDGTIDAAGKRGCGFENDSGGGGAGGSVLIVGDDVTIKTSAQVSAAGGLGGDTRAAAVGQPDYTDCPAGAQNSGTCDDCGGGGGGGIISVLSVTRSLEPGPLSQFNVSGALGGTCDVCKGEAGGGAGELQLDGAYVGEFCDGYDNDFDGSIDEGLGTQLCGLGSCQQSIAACNGGVPVRCDPDVSQDASCRAESQQARPRVAVIMDTSASMLLNLAGRPTFGDGSQEHPGITADGDSRLFLAREALAQVISAYPEIDFSLARYHQDQGLDRSCQTATWFECQGIVASYDDPTDNAGDVMCSVDVGGGQMETVKQLPNDGSVRSECINYAGSCGSPRRGADVLSGFGSQVRDIVRWLDGRETAFSADTTPGDVCLHSQGNDCELRGSGPTPLAGSLQAIEDYITPIRKQDAALSCRAYQVILVTDGAESCNEDPEEAARQLHMAGVDVNVVAVSVLPEEQTSLTAIAAAGGTIDAVFVTQPDQLVPALTGIIAGAIHGEACNGQDDDCDGSVDEDFPGLGSDCDDGKQGVCRSQGKLACNASEDGVECKLDSLGQAPKAELCNELDDDCDGALDEGLDCDMTECTPRGDEMCDGRDDDCDGKVDEADPSLGRECGENRGTCRPGNIRCIAGTLQCIGEIGPKPEQCNGADDDCDGEIDDMAPCPDPTACIEGACRSPCGASEFSCPVGLACVRSDVYEAEYCLPRACALCKSNERCVDDVCVDLCEGITCDEDLSCIRGVCRDCSFAGCPDGQVCYQGSCQTDGCAEQRCAAGEFCVNGECRKQCDDEACPSGQRCGAQDVCESDPCAAVSCEDGQACRAGQCAADPCASTQCPFGQVCVTASGCVDDPCAVTWCPAGTSCSVRANGTPRCSVPAPDAPNGPATFVSTSGGGGSGCSVGAGRAGATPKLPQLVLALVLFAWLRPRKRGGWLRPRKRGGWLRPRKRGGWLRPRKRGGWLRPRKRGASGGWLLALLVLSGCRAEAICLDCLVSAGAGTDLRDAGDRDGSTTVLVPPSGRADGGGGQGGGVIPSCTPLGDEVCNELDDDCDGNVDEGFDLSSDVRHCGACEHSCVAENAETACEAGECKQQACFTGFVDLDADPGCEYHCPVYPAAAEDCNGIDDDCDGVVDEELTQPDVSKLCRRTKGTPCAGVGVVCATREQKTTWFCDYPDSVDFDPAIANGIFADEQRCDGMDNDCDGLVDEPWPDVGQTCDDGKIGACRNGGVRVCASDERSTRCDLSVLPDPDPTAGPDAPELCNGVDDNCDGIVDNSDPSDPHRVIDEMVAIDRPGHTYYIYRYEASRVDALADAAGISAARACSRPDVQPWTLVSYAAASAACAASGKRLCTGEEWQWACEGSAQTAYPYGTDYVNDACNGADHDVTPGGALDNAVLATGSLSTCQSEDGVFDLSGNLKEWVDEQDGSADPPIYVVRGGSFESPRLGLTCQTALSQAVASSVLPGLGFRCCSDSAP